MEMTPARQRTKNRLAENNADRENPIGVVAFGKVSQRIFLHITLFASEVPIMKKLEEAILKFEEKKGSMDAKRKEEMDNRIKAIKEFESAFESAYKFKLKPILDRHIEFLKEKDYCVKLSEETPINGATGKAFTKNVRIQIGTEKRRGATLTRGFDNHSSYFEITPKTHDGNVLITHRIYPNYDKPVEKKFEIGQLDEKRFEKELEEFVLKVFDHQKL